METADNNSLFMETESMRELNRNELQQVGGAFSCQLNPALVNWAAVEAQPWSARSVGRNLRC
ncbi:hypothetical protein [Burkholderia multivorans]|uniref:hypothetical protein n=1 Tax=Burkholderia multivorans TaxID=87883 RepID=UPI001C612015|nr:hypothetical protein [Burkholderia multivorans]MBU9650818.1 hypothetical protein [Burkholderia multivorans]MBY4795193.1 hypothetical protein [Burkholderia multivorans]